MTGVNPPPQRSPALRIAVAVAIPVACASWLMPGVVAPDLDAPTLAWLLLLGPLLEEFAFRGALQGTLLRLGFGQRRAGGLTVANALASAAFVGFHLVMRGPFAAALVVAPSLLLGAIREQTGRVGPCVAVHGLWNGAWLGTASIAGPALAP